MVSNKSKRSTKGAKSLRAKSVGAKQAKAVKGGSAEGGHAASAAKVSIKFQPEYSRSKPSQTE